MENNQSCIVVNRAVWEKMSEDERKAATFTTLASIDERLKKLEKWGSLRNIIVFFGSMVGGALMILLLVLFDIKVVK